jgi:hypothetical protein
MMRKILMLTAVAMLAFPSMAAGKTAALPATLPATPNKQNQQTDREYWAGLAYKLSKPLLEPMSRGELQSTMPMEYSPVWDGRDRDVAWMEAFGRLMAGIAPWIALPDDGSPEGRMRAELKDWALKSYVNAVDPDSPDYLGWKANAMQVIVDASYIANSFLRAPEALWEPLDEVTKARYVAEFKSLRRIATPYNNWLLFRAMIEAFLMSIGEEYDGFALRQSLITINEWYLGDGWYADGPEFSLDYYNSYVINPMVVEIVEAMAAKKVYSPISFDLALRRMQRYNILQERLISPEGTFPPMGRSMTYRMGAWQPLALSAWRYGLPENLTAGGVRSALTAVMKRMFGADGAGGANFNEAGYLVFGFTGDQPEITDYYTNTGSLYITSLVFLPLGLPADDAFWTAPAEKWTSAKAWGGEPFPKDYHESVRR